KLRLRTKELQPARVRLSSDSRLLLDDFTHALSSSADRLARERRQSRWRIQSFRPAHLCADHLLFYWDSSACKPANGTANTNQQSAIGMSPAFTFFIGLLLLILFGWYFATDYGLRKRLLAALLAALLIAFSIATIWPPEKKIALGLDIKGGTSFLIKLQQVDKDKPITPGLLDQAVEVIRKRVDYFGAGEPIISPVGQDRILVQIPRLD